MIHLLIKQTMRKNLIFGSVALKQNWQVFTLKPDVGYRRIIPIWRLTAQ